MQKCSKEMMVEKLIKPLTVQWGPPRHLTTVEDRSQFIEQLLEAMATLGLTAWEVEPLRKRMLTKKRHRVWPDTSELTEELRAIRQQQTEHDAAQKADAKRDKTLQRTLESRKKLEQGPKWAHALLSGIHGRRAVDGGYCGHLHDWALDHIDEYPTGKDHARWIEGIAYRRKWMKAQENGSDTQVSRELYKLGLQLEAANVALTQRYAKLHYDEKLGLLGSANDTLPSSGP